MIHKYNYIYHTKPNFLMKSKYFPIGLTILLAAIVVVSGCVGQSSEPAVTLNQNTVKFTTYENSQYSVKISYPEDWKPGNDANTILFFVSSKGQSINLVYNDYSKNPMTLDKFTEEVQKYFDTISIDLYPPVPKKTTVSGNPGYYVIYNTKFGNIDVRVMQAWTIKNDKVYSLTYGGPIKEFDESLGKRIIDSFEITASKAI